MNDETAAFTPAQAHKFAMEFIVRRIQEKQTIFLRANITEDCISQIKGFEEFPEDIQDEVNEVLLDAVIELVDRNILFVGDVIFEINPDLPEILSRCANCTVCRNGDLLQTAFGNA